MKTNDDSEIQYEPRSDNPMKIIVLPTILIVLCILATGCVGQIKNVPTDVSTVTPVNTFTTFSNATNTPETSSIPETPTIPETVNISNVTNTSGQLALKGQLKISISGWLGEGTVLIDGEDVGVTTTQKPLILMLEEGNHIIEVCCGTHCEREDASIRFGQHLIMDFSEQLKRNCEFLEPTARINGYSMSGDKIAVNVEFINPTVKTVSMTAEITCGYSYIESRSDNRVGNVARGQLFQSLAPGQRVTRILELDLASGYSYSYNIPTITRQTLR